MVNVIYKVISREAWTQAVAQGVFDGAPIDHRDGYIHFSTADQLQETIEKHFTGQTDLVILAVNARQLGAPLKWERSRGGANFPHLYAQLDLDAVLWCASLGDTLTQSAHSEGEER